MRLSSLTALSLTLYRGPRTSQAFSSKTHTLQHPFCSKTDTIQLREANMADSNASEAPAQPQEPSLGLPEPQGGQNVHQLDMSNGQDTVSLDHLGPMIVNVDGTLSRISNWGEMSEIEKKNTLRVLGVRNKARLKALKDNGGD